MMTGIRVAGRVPGWVVLLVCCLAQFMVVLDISVVTVALPQMRLGLGMSGSAEQWIINAYTLTFGGLLLLGGRASDLFGRRRMFVCGLALFTLASLAGGLAQDGGWLIAARAAQGVGGAVLAPATLSVLTTTFTDPAERRRALGFWSAVAASGAAAGVLAGGALTEFLGWRWVLFINVPIGAALVVAASVAVAESTGGLAHRHLDLAGALTVTGGMTALVYGVLSAQARAWGSPVTVGTLAAAGLLLAGFGLIEAWVAPHPLVPLHLFRHRALTMANVIGVTNGAGLFGMYIFLSLYLQQASHDSPLRSGLAFLPVGLSTMAGALYGARLVARIGIRTQLAAGLLAGVAGLGWLSRLTAGAPYASHVLVPLLLAGTGFGMAIVPLTMSATTGVPASQAGLASGLIQTSRQIGGAVGLAAMGTAAAAVTSHARAGSAAAALASGYDRAFAIAAVTLLAGAALTPLLPTARHRAARPAAAPEPQAAPAPPAPAGPAPSDPAGPAPSDPAGPAPSDPVRG
jgi:EmrB/QacA subfamily drug resistance transporter